MVADLINAWVNEHRSPLSAEYQGGDGRIRHSIDAFMSKNLGSLAFESRYEKAPEVKLVEYGERIATAYFSQLSKLALLNQEIEAARQSPFNLKQTRDRGSRKLAIEIAWNQEASAIQEAMKQDKGLSAINTTSLFGTILHSCMAVGKEQFDGLELRTNGGPKWTNRAALASAAKTVNSQNF